MEQQNKIVARNYYTVKEAREIVFNNNISLTTLHKLMNKNVIPFTQLCRKRLTPAWWVDMEIEKGRVRSVSE